MSDLCQFLQDTQLFQGLPWEYLQILVKIAQKKQYKRNEFIFLEGDQAEGFFVILSGQVKICKISSEGKEQILHWFSSGDNFAEVPAFDGKPYPASAIALESTELLFFPKQTFFELLAQEPNLAINLIVTLSRHLRRFAHLIETLSLRAVPGRLAIYLLNLSEINQQADTVKLELSKTHLASFLGTIPETLSRVFAKLSQDGVIELKGSRVKLLDRERLEELAMGES
ncbi:Crp/Fnr family transcriptional regulator [Spirulina sp. CS-785/01]|uniref:Crp/Fnr family transcriptional regulator n=1 Tax=Spirulina sp. CS-785/01 TaxID=3021716 RepID=UPI00232B1BF9|nr:Crp/Fnr family transcriptional regulator [Spirulina sp. CS-785/01]MDB9315002.1 Crp/Fnr family transcriptional regulator [Spirulina sp. CS-785/01]